MKTSLIVGAVLAACCYFTQPTAAATSAPGISRVAVPALHLEGRNRKGSKRTGGRNSHGKGSHYRGGH